MAIFESSHIARKSSKRKCVWMIRPNDTMTHTHTQREALQMIASKLARIASGDANHQDSWIDIAGYAKLAADSIL